MSGDFETLPVGTWAELERLRVLVDELRANIEQLERTAAVLREALDGYFKTRQAGKYLSSGDFLVDGDEYLAAYEAAERALVGP